MAIVFSRVDERAVHGQTVVAWSKIYDINGIILVSDEIANDPTLRTIYKNAAFGTKVFIFTLEQAYIKVKEAAASKNNYMLIARTPIIFEKLLDAGIDFGKRLVIGPMSAAPGRTIVAKGTCLTDEEIECCKRMVEKGIQIVMQLFPDNPAVDFFSLKIGK